MCDFRFAGHFNLKTETLVLLSPMLECGVTSCAVFTVAVDIFLKFQNLERKMYPDSNQCLVGP